MKGSEHEWDVNIGINNCADEEGKAAAGGEAGEEGASGGGEGWETEDIELPPDLVRLHFISLLCFHIYAHMLDSLTEFCTCDIYITRERV